MRTKTHLASIFVALMFASGMAHAQTVTTAPPATSTPSTGNDTTNHNSGTKGGGTTTTTTTTTPSTTPSTTPVTTPTTVTATTDLQAPDYSGSMSPGFVALAQFGIAMGVLLTFGIFMAYLYRTVLWIIGAVEDDGSLEVSDDYPRRYRSQRYNPAQGMGIQSLKAQQASRGGLKYSSWRRAPGD